MHFLVKAPLYWLNQFSFMDNVKLHVIEFPLVSIVKVSWDSHF